MLGAVASALATSTFTELGSNESPAWAGTISYPPRRTICTFIDARTSKNARERIATVGRSHRRGVVGTGEGCRSKGRAAWEEGSSTAVDDVCLGFRKRCAWAPDTPGCTQWCKQECRREAFGWVGYANENRRSFIVLFNKSLLSAPTRR